MIKSWFKIFITHSIKNKVFTFLTIFGLAIGITSLIFALLYWNNETSYNKWNPNREVVFEVLSNLPSGEKWEYTQAGLAKNIKLKSNKLQDYCYYLPNYIEENVIVNGKNNYATNIIISQSNFFDFFPFEFINGNIDTFKKNKNSIALEEREAKSIFGDKNPINQIMSINDEIFVITGVFKLNELSSIKPKYVVSTIDSDIKRNESEWGNYNYCLLLKINKKDIQEIERVGEEVLTTFKVVEDSKYKGLSVDEYLREYGKYTIELQSLDEARLSKKISGFSEGKGNRVLLHILVGLSILILILSVINYINLSTAQAMKRAKEVGVRKVFGASKKNIVYQFVFETSIITFFALLFALCLTELCLPYYNNLIGKSLVLNIVDFGFYLVYIFLIVVLFAGFFPAVYIANFEELKVLKGNFSRSKNGIWVRNSMLILQFTIATFFIVSGLIVTQQVDYLSKKDLGFKGNQILSVNYTISNNDKYKLYEAFKNDLAKIKGVEDVNISTLNFGRGAGSSSGFSLPNSKFSTQAQNVAFDFGYFDLFKMKIIEGRDLDSNIVSDSTKNVLLNERAIRDLGGKVPLGTEFEWNGKKFKLIGIVKDFNLRSPQEEVPPMLFMHMRTVDWMTSNITNFVVKIDSENTEETLANLEKFWKEKIDANTPFSYEFIDKKFARSYESYSKQKAMFNILNAIVIGIALFGLFALSSFTIERKYKEIAIRKVLGAETGSLLKLLTQQYIVMVVIGFILALIPSYYLMQKWLENFHYRIDIEWMVYVFAFFLLLILTLIVVISKAFFATRLNLLNYLKYE